MASFSCSVLMSLSERSLVGSSILIYTGIPRGRSSGRFLALEGEGITWMGQPSRQGIALFSVRIEFWRSTGHAPAHVSERYVKLLNDRSYRLDWAERVGTGFVLP